MSNSNRYIVYFIQTGDLFSPIKIGFTKNIKKRIEQFQTSTPNKVRLLATVNCKCELEMRCTETSMHSFFKHKRIRGEWFDSIIITRMGEVKNIKWVCNDAYSMCVIPDRYRTKKRKEEKVN